MDQRLPNEIECPGCGVIQGQTFDPSNHFPDCPRRRAHEAHRSWSDGDVVGPIDVVVDLT